MEEARYLRRTYVTPTELEKRAFTKGLTINLPEPNIGLLGLHDIASIMCEAIVEASDKASKKEHGDKYMGALYSIIFDENFREATIMSKTNKERAVELLHEVNTMYVKDEIDYDVWTTYIKDILDSDDGGLKALEMDIRRRTKGKHQNIAVGIACRLSMAYFDGLIDYDTWEIGTKLALTCDPNEMAKSESILRDANKKEDK